MIIVKKAVKNELPVAKEEISEQAKEQPVQTEPKMTKEEMAAQKKREKIKKEKIKLAQKYTDEVVKKFKKVVKAVVLFGSFTRKDFKETSDIDMLVIIDDTTARFTPEMKEGFDNKLHEIGKDISKDISVQPSWTLTEFWDMARVGHPLLYTIVRDGWALYDTGFFIPVRKLLEAGKVPHTLEAIELLMHGAPKKIERVENAKLYMIAEDLYYAMLNSSQAVLMFMGRNSPSPKHAPQDVKEYLVNTKMLNQKFLKSLEEVIEFRKDVEHKKTKKVSGEKLDELIKKTSEYVGEMQKLLFSMQMKRKETMIVKNYEVMIKAAVACLKAYGKLPKDPKDLPSALKECLMDTKKISPFYEDVLKRSATMRKMIDDKQLDKIPQRDVEMMQEYVRRFVREIGIAMERDKKALPKEGAE